jgi:uncharacterized protein
VTSNEIEVVQSGSAAPVVEPERIRSIDVLRGFALLGVLAMNMQAFADIFPVYMNPFAAGDISAIDYACWCFNHVLADTKFMTIFSMLFGAGIVLMTSRSKKRTGRAAGVHYRRMFWLVLFGFAHATLLWNGDILFFYGVIGMIAFLMRRFWTWLLLVLAALLFLVPAFFLTFIHKMPAEDMQELSAMWSPTAEYIETTRATLRGGWLDQIAFRFEEWLGMMGFLFLFGWRILANMLIGMALFRTGVFSATRSRGFYVALIAIGFAIGLPMVTWGIYDHEACDWDMVRSMGVGSLFNYFGSLFVAFGWIGLVMLICHAGALPGLRERFAAVGQMAFTNYIMHSVICTTIYNGYGLGLFGHVDRIWQMFIIAGIFALQLWYSPLWLQRFRFGPLEWLWRALTYWSRPPFRRAAA